MRCGHAIPDAARIIGLTESMADQLIGQTLTHTHTRPLGIGVFVAVIEAINDFGAVRTYMVYVWCYLFIFTPYPQLHMAWAMCLRRVHEILTWNYVMYRSCRWTIYIQRYIYIASMSGINNAGTCVVWSGCVVSACARVLVDSPIWIIVFVQHDARRYVAEDASIRDAHAWIRHARRRQHVRYGWSPLRAADWCRYIVCSIGNIERTEAADIKTCGRGPPEGIDD